MSAVKRDLEHCVGGGCGREEAPAKRSRRAECSNDAAFEEVLSPAQYSRDLGHLKSLQRLNAAYDQGLKYVQYRGLLVSFVMDVCAEFKLMKITMHRSLNYLDRLLSKHTHISRQCYQLVATACILVAGEHSVPKCGVFALPTAHALPSTGF